MNTSEDAAAATLTRWWIAYESAVATALLSIRYGRSQRHGRLDNVLPRRHSCVSHRSEARQWILLILLVMPIERRLFSLGSVFRSVLATYSSGVSRTRYHGILTT